MFGLESKFIPLIIIGIVIILGGMMFVSFPEDTANEAEFLTENDEPSIVNIEIKVPVIKEEATDPLKEAFKVIVKTITKEVVQEKQKNEYDPIFEPPSLQFNPEWGKCEDKEVSFTFSPMNPEVIKLIEPMGRMAPSHTFPTPHMYISDNIGWDNPGRTITYDVIAPADGLIINIGALSNVNEYNIIVWYSCSLVGFFHHVYDLTPEILATIGELPSGSQWEASNKNAIFVKAGQRIARSKGTFDFSVRDNKIVLTGLLRGGTQIHLSDPFDYFIEPIRSQMLKKNPRTVEPVGGKINYDIDGRLAGNWFEDASGVGVFDVNFQKGRLAISYDFINPTLVQISFGAEDEIGITHDDCRGCGWVYGVTGNKPDPADVSVLSGQVKYELLARESATDARGFRVRINTTEVLGVFLVQMLDDRTFKGEVFPKKTASQVTGFTNNAKIYKR